MSIINQVLQDLDRRRASNAERNALPNQARALPPQAAPNRLLWWGLAIIAIAGLMAAIAWQARALLGHGPQAPAQTAPVATVAPPAEDDVTPKPRMALDLTTPVAELEATPPPKPTEAAPPPSSQPSPAPELASRPKSKSKPKSAMRPAVMPSNSVVSSVNDGVKSIMLGEPQNTSPSDQIEKQMHALTPQQLAENEYRHAVDLLDQKRLLEAQDALEAALKLNPAHVGARQGLFGLLLAAKKTGEAEQVLQEGLTLNPNQPGFALALARLQAERGDTQAAIATMQNSAAAAQNNPEYLASLAALLQRAGRHAEAVEHYQAALQLTSSGVWWMGLGISLQALDRKAEARDAFTRAKSSNTLTPDLQAFVEQHLQQLQ